MPHSANSGTNNIILVSAQMAVERENFGLTHNYNDLNAKTSKLK